MSTFAIEYFENACIFVTVRSLLTPTVYNLISALSQKNKTLIGPTVYVCELYFVSLREILIPHKQFIYAD